MNRRQVIGAGVGLLVGAAGIGVTLVNDKALIRRIERKWIRMISSEEVAVASEFQGAFRHLHLGHVTCLEFVRGYREAYGHLPRTPVTDRDKKRLLLSTNFVQEKGNATRKLRYMAFYDPYVSPCYNPFNEV